MVAIVDVRMSLGAVFIGCIIAIALSGVMAAQTFLFYFRMFPEDPMRIKVMNPYIEVVSPGIRRLLDFVHACLMCSATWNYLILNFGDPAILDHIPGTLASTVALTAAVSFIVHLFFSHRVLRLSKNNWYITAPLVLLAFMRLASAIGMLSRFLDQWSSIFTLGLCLSSVLDVLIAFSLCFFLQISRTGFGSMDHVIDMIMLYTFNNGALTWWSFKRVPFLAMRHNLVWLALYFAISKLYANSLLASTIRQTASALDSPLRDDTGTKVHISVEKAIQFDVEPHERREAGQPSEHELDVV
ncbi:hypothetical protein HETIRDRAFT_427125 [Heterobasidion irregulare TC 32-1]|uniref:DUF6534 domain-containing protein n=1 Tax=Heterobasidion irregulare (strain TC 32-1) TaxID=747525 RepID=W4K7Q9_HETIT|nr:uncharacterized protein HETIRDRAFT_427125 [Heterobasidion irregulare TC 32-1]ETW81862.1 hypothetical protein HETIRDRAFT_427125 [Heterobasidion irregulare TC 32-1]